MHILFALAVVCAAFAAAWFLAPRGWRTFAFNALNALACLPPILAAVFDSVSGFDWTQLMDKTSAATVTLAVTIGNVVFRAVTTTPLGRRDRP